MTQETVIIDNHEPLPGRKYYPGCMPLREACSQAPVIVVDDKVQGRVRPSKFPHVIRKLQTEGT